MTLEKTQLLGLPQEAAHLVAEWASKKPQIQKVQFFGSRVKGTYHEKSDLDVAITIVTNLDECGGFSIWCRYGEKWVEELKAMIPCAVDAQWEAGQETKIIQDGLKEASYLVYEIEI